MDQELAECGPVRLVWQRVDVELHRPNDFAVVEGGREQQAAPVGDGARDPRPERIGLRGAQRGEEPDRGAVLDAVDQDLAERGPQRLDRGRVDLEDPGAVQSPTG
jgi:hypothetical protein